MRFTDKVAVVTGGASGMGAATARLLAWEGAAVLIADLSEAGQQVSKEIGGGGGPGGVHQDRRLRPGLDSRHGRHGHRAVREAQPGG